MRGSDIAFGWRVIDAIILVARKLHLERLARVRPYLLVAPALLLVSLLAVGIFYLGWLSIHSYDTFLLKQGPVSAEQYRRLFEPPSGAFYMNTLQRTLIMSVLVTFSSMLLGMPAAYFIVRTPSRAWRVTVLVLLLVPFLMGEIVRTFAWFLILANRGALGWFLGLFGVQDGGILGTPLGVYVGMLQVSVPLVALLVMPAVRRIDPNLERAAATLGASPARVWRHVLIPLAWPGLAAAVVVVLLLNIAEYDMPAILGLGRLPFVANIIGDIYTLQQNLYLGSAFSLVLLAVSSTMIAVPFLLIRFFLTRRARRGS
ncbi:MAG TPA: ABC transporter permease [Rhodobacteraceae bacterium]|nr:ABC transporter permease [Paracoccaceae bacterium]